MSDYLNNQTSFQDMMARLAAGDDDASRRIVDRFACALIARAKGQLSGRLRAKVDPEDAVQSAFRSFFCRQADGQFDLADWGNLWTLLLSITIAKCLNLRRYYHRGLRNIDLEIAGSQHPVDNDPVWEALDGEPTPEEEVMLVDGLEYFLDSLNDHERLIVELRLQNYTPNEISTRVPCAERTVFRVLKRARDRLEQIGRTVH